MSEYAESAVLVEIASSVWAGNKFLVRIDIEISDKMRVKFFELLDKDIQNAFITDSDMRHIKKKHGQNEKLRGQIDVIPEDFAFLPLILNEFDNAEQESIDKMGNKRVLLKKTVDRRLFLAVVERGSKVHIRSFWEMPVSGASC